MKMALLGLVNASSNASYNGTTEIEESLENFKVSPLTVFKMTYYGMASATSIVGNTLLITTVCKRSALQKNSYHLISNLAFKDLLFALLTGVLVIPGIFWNQWIFGHVMCIIYAFLSTWLAYAEIVLLVAISVDRYFSCIYPLRYNQMVTGKRIRFGLIFCWTYSLLWALVPFSGLGGYRYEDNLLQCQLDWTNELLPKIYTYTVGTFCFYPGTGIIVFCYLKIYRQATKMKEPPRVSTIHSQSKRPVGEPVKSKATRRSNKATLTVGLITVIYFLCWVPYVGIRISRKYVRSYDDIKALQLTEEGTTYTFTIANFINPIIYGIYNREFRGEFTKMFKAGHTRPNFR